MGDNEYYTAFAHVVLAGTSIWVLRSLHVTASPYSYTWAYGTFGLHLFRSALGIFRFGNPAHGEKAREFYDHTAYVSILLGLPCMATQLYLNYHYKPEISYLHVAFAAVPLVCYVLKEHASRWQEFLHVLLTCNMVSVGYVSFINDNYYGIAMAVCYAINYFAIGTSGRVCDLPAIDLFTYGLCFFNFFAIKALRDY